MIKPLRLRSFLLYGGIAAILLVAVAGAYVFVFQANSRSDQYSQRVRQSAIALNSSFAKLAKTVQLDVFNNPDAAHKRADLDSVLSDISSVKTQLTDFKNSANQRQPIPHIGLSASYRDADITQGHAADITDQSADVIEQYQQLALFLKKFYAIDDNFIAITGQLNGVSNLDSLAPDSGQVYSYGSQLAGLADEIDKLKVPFGYSQLQTEAAAIYRKSSQGANLLAYGLTTNNDTYKSSGIYMVEQATDEHDDKLANLPTDQAQTSYVLTQVGDLPDKTDGIIAAADNGY